MLQAFCTWLAGRTDPPMNIGVDLFADHRPDGAGDLCTVVRELVGARVDPWLRNEREVHYQFVTRGPTNGTARAEAERVFEAAVNRWGYALDGWRIHATNGSGPARFGEDEQGRTQYVANLTLRVRREET